MDPVKPKADDIALLKKKVLFRPCKTKKDLQNWVITFLGVELPDCTVSPESNSNPMDLLWEMYSVALTNNDDDAKHVNRVMAYAARGAGKTLVASILELLVMLHTRRNITHMAAVKDQAAVSQEYIRDFFDNPYIAPFRTSTNVMRLEIERYEHVETKDNLTRKEWGELPLPDRKSYRKYKNKVQIVICTLSGVNGKHSEFMCVTGDTKILVKTTGKRERKAIKASGIFNSISGRHSSGRYGHEDSIIREPSTAIEVLSLSKEFALEFKPITAGSRRTAECVEVRTVGGQVVCCSLEHPFYVQGRGYVEAGALAAGDKLFWLGKHRSKKSKKRALSAKAQISDVPIGDPEEWVQVLLGSLLGDGGIYRKPTNNAYVKEQHCLEQAKYLEWKFSLLEKKFTVREGSGISGYTGKSQVSWSTVNSVDLNPFVSFKKTFEGIDRLGPLGLAIWYMDDGCAGNSFRLSTECWSREENQFLADFLLKQFGIKVAVGSYSKGEKTYFYLRGGVAAKRRLEEICRPYIHPDMAYKFDLSGNKEKCSVCSDEFWHIERGNRGITCAKPECNALMAVAATTAIESITPVGLRTVYDFTVADNHNFFANGILVHNCVDEVDVVPTHHEKAYHQSNQIPTTKRGLVPFTLLTSTRKSGIGLVQREIDKAEDTGLILRHWNIIDVTQACPTSRHQPDKPMTDMYIRDSDLEVWSESRYSQASPSVQAGFEKVAAYAGCLNCKLFSACKGSLATKQTFVPKDTDQSMVRPILEVIGKFKSSPINEIITDMLCRKPDESGMVYPKFSRAVHAKTAAEMAAIVLGEDQDEGKWDKNSLLKLLLDRGAEFYLGMDFGMTHDFAVTMMAVWGGYGLIVDVLSEPGLELDDKIAVCGKYLPFQPTCFGDPESPSDIKTFKRKGGFRMREWDKGAGSVKAGIESVRMKLRPFGRSPELYYLKDDPGVELLMEDIRTYGFEVDATGQVGENPKKKDDDRLDSMRYVVMNVFAPNGVPRVMEPPKKTVPPPTSPFVDTKQTHSEQFKSLIQSIAPDDDLFGKKDKETKVQNTQTKGFWFDIA